MQPLTLTADELHELTGYRSPRRQLTELQRQGYYRARLSPTTGRVILERAHLDAVCRGHAANDMPRPKLRPLRAA